MTREPDTRDVVYHPKLKPHATCKRKVTYRSRKRADNAFEQMMTKRPPKNIETLALYECPHCKMWHLGNRKRKAKV